MAPSSDGAWVRYKDVSLILVDFQLRLERQAITIRQRQNSWHEMKGKLTEAEQQREQETQRRQHTEEWYAARLQWLEDWFRTIGKDLPIAEQFWHILANGTPGLTVPPTYQQQLNQAKFRAEGADARAEEATRLAERQGNELVEMEGRLREATHQRKAKEDRIHLLAAELVEMARTRQALVDVQKERDHLTEVVRILKREYSEMFDSRQALVEALQRIIGSDATPIRSHNDDTECGWCGARWMKPDWRLDPQPALFGHPLNDCPAIIAALSAAG